MSTNQTDFTTKSTLTQEQARNVGRQLRVLRKPSLDGIPLDDISDTGALKPIMKDLIKARQDGGLDGLESAIKSLHLDYKLDELSKPGKYQPVTLLEMARAPRPKWIIDGWIYENTVGNLYGESGCMKTFLTFDWSAHIAMGRPWLGHSVAAPGKVVYLLAEGADSFIARAYAWCKHNNVHLEALSKNLLLVPQELPLSNGAEVTEYINSVSEYLCNVAPVMVVFDTLMRCSNGGNINAPEIMQALFDGANRARRDLGATHALIVHHEGKDRTRGGAGSFALRANCDSVWHQERDKTTGSIALTADKMKDKPELTKYLNTALVPYGDDSTNLDDSSLVIVQGDKPIKTERLTSLQEHMLAILDTHTTLTYTAWLKFAEAEAIKKPTFNENLRKLRDIAKVVERAGEIYKRGGVDVPVQAPIDDAEEAE